MNFPGISIRQILERKTKQRKKMKWNKNRKKVFSKFARNKIPTIKKQQKNFELMNPEEE